MRKDRKVVWFEDVGKDDIPLVGGKGANLGELTKAGIPVPPGFIVTAHGYYSFLEQSKLADEIRSLLSSLDPDDSLSLIHISEPTRPY